MKIFKLIGLPYYIVAISKEHAVAICLANKIGVVKTNLEETSIRNYLTKAELFKSLESLEEAQDIASDGHYYYQ